MIKFLGKLPDREFILATSGGEDSMAVLDFLCQGGRKPIVAYFHHGTDHGDAAQTVVNHTAMKYDCTFRTGQIRSYKPDPGKSQEEHWRDERYEWLRSFNLPIITAHHLDDAVETWLFNCFHGKPRTIPYHNQGVFRPFLVTSKNDLGMWAERNHVNFIEDPSNADTRFMRNYIRHHVVDRVERVNPGLKKVVAKMVKKEFMEGNL